MPKPIFKNGLEILEKNELDISILIDHATTILNIDLVEVSRRHLEHVSGETTAVDATFREQWTLRWLLKRFNWEQNPSQGEYTPTASNRYNVLSLWKMR